MAHAKVLVVVGLLVSATIPLAGALGQDERPRRLANVTLDDEGCPQGPDRFCAQPDVVELEENTDLVLRITNEGRIEHNLTFGEEVPPALAKHGMNGTLAVEETHRMRIPWPDLEAGLEETGSANATLECGREGHAALGEKLRIHVPSIAAGEERPQPGPGALGALVAVGLAAFVARRRG